MTSFLKNIICSINHVQLSGAMETAGVLSFFSEHIQKYNVRYSHYIGDGDTDSYAKVVDSKPYEDDLVLNALDTSKNGLVLVCEKFEMPIKGRSSRRGRLTDKTINNKTQNFYGMSITQNSIINWNGDREMALDSMKTHI